MSGRGVCEEPQRRITVERPGACGGQWNSFRSGTVDSLFKIFILILGNVRG